MPDPTSRLSLTELLNQLPDNNENLITPHDVRDIIGTLTAQYGRLVVLPGAGFTYPGNAGMWDELTQDDWTLDGIPVGFDESAGNGRLTYTGARPVLANVTLNMSALSEGKETISFRMGVNGVVDANGSSEISVDATDFDQIVSMTTTAAGLIVPGDFISCFGRSSGNDDVTVTSAHISIVTQPV